MPDLKEKIKLLNKQIERLGEQLNTYKLKYEALIVENAKLREEKDDTKRSD